MYYFNYFIKCCIRNLTRILFKPKYFFTIVIILLLSFFLFKIDSLAVYEGDDTYTDKNNSIILAYDSICNDFLTRLFQNSGTDLGEEIKNRLKDSQYSYYIYYGNLNGSSLINASTFNTRTMHIYFWRNNNPNISATIYDDWQGINTNIYLVSGTGYTYTFEGNTIAEQFDITPCYIPNVLIGYENSNIINYITNSSTEQTNSINSTIQEESDEMQNTITQSTESIKDTLTDSTVDESTMTVNTENMAVNDSEGIDNFFTNFLSMIQGVFINIDDSVETIEIGIPFTGTSIILYSDMISRYIQNTTLYTLIQAMWWFVIGGYIVIFCKRMLDWLSTGEIAERGVWAFIAYLDKNNELLKSYMM